MKIVFSLCVALIIITSIAFGYRQYERTLSLPSVNITIPEPAAIIPVVVLPEEVLMTSVHMPTPVSVRGIYLSAWTAGSKKAVERLITLAHAQNVNAVVIDIKDATGRLSYQPLDPELRASGVGTRKIPDLPALTSRMHEEGLYVIGRIAVFQDPYRATLYPDQAFRTKGSGALWRDSKGLAWLRADEIQVWEYTSSIAHDAYAQGFDEINVDYVRYPSDGPLDTIEGRAGASVRAETIEKFFVYLNEHIRARGIVLSADLFGLTMTATGDIGIGQELLRIAPYVDVVAPMIYPSHFAAGSYGYANPSIHPYEIIKRALADGTKKLATIGIGPEKLRPWLQDFDLLGIAYTPSMVADQIKATDESGATGWMMWDPKNTYRGLGGI